VTEDDTRRYCPKCKDPSKCYLGAILMNYEILMRCERCGVYWKDEEMIEPYHKRVVKQRQKG